MYVTKGDIVILAETEQIQLKDYVGLEWRVDAVMDAYHPASAMISRDNLKATAYIRHLEVMPPMTSPFSHNESVKICKSYVKAPGISHTCNRSIIGRVGRVRGYDSRSGYYLVRCSTGGQGWFPIQSLLPLDFRGERFYYPHERVMYEGTEKIITNIKSSKFNWGQLLLVDGVWVPSSDVESTT